MPQADGRMERCSSRLQPKAAPAAPKTATPSTPSASTSTPAPPAAPQPNPASTATSNPPTTPSPAGAGAAAAATTATAPTSASQAPASFNDPSALLVGQQGNEVIAQMEAMGFARAEIDRAMRAAYFNPDRAVDYLLNGIPESVQAEQRQAAAARANPSGDAAGEGQGAGTGAQPTRPTPATGGTAGTTGTDEPVNLFEAAAQAGGRGGATGGAGAGAGGRGAAVAGAGLAGAPANLDFLRNSPQFQQLRQLVQQQPAMLEPVLQQVAEGNPQLAQMIGQNQEQFLQLLSEVTLYSPRPRPLCLSSILTY